jgi:NhaP-type Na+/H+ and K+/H+ antiporter
MVPKGLAAAVLAGLPLAAGMPGGQHLQNLAYAVVLLSITVSAVMIIGLERGSTRVAVDRFFGRFPAEPANAGSSAPG